MKGDTSSEHVRRVRPILITATVIACLLALAVTRIPTVSEARSAHTGTTHQLFDLLNGLEAIALHEIFTDDAMIQSPDGQFEGPTGAREYMATLTKAFPTASFTVQRLEIVNDTVVAQWTMTGVQYGDYQGRPASCAGVAVTGAAILQFEDQLIDRVWIHYDRLSLVRQIELFSQVDSGSRPTCRHR